VIQYISFNATFADLNAILLRCFVCNGGERSYKECKKRLDERNSICRHYYSLDGQKHVGVEEKFDQWKRAFEFKAMKVNLGMTKLIVGGIEKEITNSKVDPCGVCRKRVMANLILCTIG